VSDASATTNPEEHAHDEHGHDGPWFLGHHWENPQQQFEAGKLGMWLFLATEVLLFGGLFCGYAVWRGNHPELFRFGSEFLDTTMGAINTAVLIASSLSMAWAVTAAQQNKQRLLKIMLLITLAGAFTFLVIKYFEYTHKFHEGIYPGMAYYQVPEHAETFDKKIGVYSLSTLAVPVVMPEPDLSMPISEPSTVPKASQGQSGLNLDALSEVERGDLDQEAIAGLESELEAEQASETHDLHHLQDPLRPKDAHMFFNIYFMMTGLHGIHVLIGIFVISWLLYKAQKGQFSDKYFTPVDLGGLYWHVVDLIWIFLFPLFYLI
jgi:cytochrome c oxidase subunit 3